MRLFAFLMGIVALSADVPRAHAGFVYFSDSLVGGGTIRRMDQDGSNLRTITPTGGRPWAMAIDRQGGHLYWTSTFTTAIRRSNLDGSDVRDLITFPTEGGFDGGLALDLAGGKMYWTDREPTRRGIYRANLDGSNIERLISSGLGPVHAVALDVARGKMYWADGPSINRANLDGTGRETILQLTTAGAYGLALDLAAGKMYWSEINVAAPRTGQLRRANLDGTGVELLLGGLNSLRGVTLDTAGGHLYFTEFIETTVPMGFVSRINLDGTGRVNLLSQQGSLPFSIALDLDPVSTPVPEPASLTLLGLGALGALAYRWKRGKA